MSRHFSFHYSHFTSLSDIPGFLPIGKLVLLSTKFNLEVWIGEDGLGTLPLVGENLEPYSLLYRAELIFFDSPARFSRLLFA